MYELWPDLEEIEEFALIDDDHMKVKASGFDRTALWHVQVPTAMGEFVIGASAFGVAMGYFPGVDDFDIIDRDDYYGIGLASWGKKRAIEAGIELMGYSVGDVLRFECPIDLSYLTPFQQDVLLAVHTVPFGETITISELAVLSGQKRKYAAIANVVKHNPLPIYIPCHRVMPTKGGMGNWSGPEGWKRFLLEHEGVALKELQA